MAVSLPDWRHWLRVTLDLVLARDCVSCGGSVAAERGHLCWECRRQLPLLGLPFCQRCGDPIEGNSAHAFQCGSCCDREPAFVLARSAVRYRGPARDMIHAFKYGNMPCLAPELAELMAAAWQAYGDGCIMDLVTCVPLYAKRERERGYNQAALLGQSVSRWLKVDFDPFRLSRPRETPTQTNLDAAERRRNVRGAFEARQDGWTRGRRLLLVDDVMTTGATVRECSAALMEAGARDVRVLTVARG